METGTSHPIPLLKALGFLGPLQYKNSWLRLCLKYTKILFGPPYGEGIHNAHQSANPPHSPHLMTCFYAQYKPRLIFGLLLAARVISTEKLLFVFESVLYNLVATISLAPFVFLYFIGALV